MSASLSPVLKRACDLTQEIIRKRACLREVQKRLGTVSERPDDFAEARHIAHALGGLAQETKLAIYLLDREQANRAAQEKEARKNRVPDFDIDGGIQWVGRTI
jgi:hypothetical protein